MTMEEFLDKYLDEAIDELIDSIPEEDVEFHPSPKFQRWLKKMIRIQRRSPRMNAVILYAKRAAIVVLALAVFTFGGFMTVEANRTKFIQMVTEVYEILTSYFYTSDMPEEVPLPEVEFGWLPEGMVEIIRNESENSRYIFFEDENGMYIDYRQEHITSVAGSGQIIDTENAEISNIMLNGIEAEVILKRDAILICWTENDIINLLTGNCTVDILKTVGENIIFK